jgi:hypothetical protein
MDRDKFAHTCLSVRQGRTCVGLTHQTAHPAIEASEHSVAFHLTVYRVAAEPLMCILFRTCQMYGSRSLTES